MFEIAKKVIVVSEEMKNDLLRIGAPKNKLVRITYAPHPRFLKLKPKYSGNQLLSVSRFVEKKAPYLTILAYKLAKDQCPDLTLKMVGDGDLLPVCKDICRYMNLDGIEFLGVKSPEEIEFEMENSFCFLQHSKMAENGDKEGTPVSILEAMAAGLPVISTKHAGIPDLVKDGNSGFLVEEGDVKLMAEKIVLLQRNKKTSHDFGQNSRKEILKNYIFSEYLERINKIIFSVV
jgi:glycosyltransferase involved in cell wall biosynthesis